MKNIESRKKKILVSISVIIVILLLALIIYPNAKYESKTKKLCNDIQEKMDSKKDIIIFYRANGITDESRDTITDIKENYKEKITTYIIVPEQFSNKCIKKIFNHTAYNDIKTIGDSAAVIYKQGKYTGMISGLDSYDNVETYFIEKNIIQKEQINENITFKEYKNNLTNDKYLLLIINNEKNRDNLTKLLEKYFPNHNYDIVNIKSNIGNKIKNDVNKNYKSFNEFPHLMYFKNEKLIHSESVIDDITFETYVDDLNNKLKK